MENKKSLYRVSRLDWIIEDCEKIKTLNYDFFFK